MSRRMLTFPLIVAIILVNGVCFAAPKHKDVYQDGIAALKKGNTAAAIDLFTRALQQTPGNHALYNDRGVAYKRMGELDKAIEDYCKAIEIKPDYVNAWNNRGVAYVQKGDLDSALKDFSAGLQHGDLQGKIFVNLGIVLTLKGDFVTAANYFDKVPSTSNLDSRALGAMGEAYENVDQKDKALKAYKQAVMKGDDPAFVSNVNAKIQKLQPPPAPAPKTVELPKLEAKSAAVPQVILKREIAPAPKNIVPETKSVTQKVPEQSFKSFEELESSVRSKVIEKLMPASAEIYKQGMQFFTNGDYVKALVRFEDVLQLERRHKNSVAVGMSLLEIGRVYNKMGEHAKAEAALEEAGKTFEKSAGLNESLLVLLESAESKKTSGQKEKARSLYAKAAEAARAKGRQDLAGIIDDIAIGRKSEPVKMAKADATDVKPSMENTKPEDTPLPIKAQTQPKTEKKQTNESAQTTQPKDIASKEATTEPTEAPKPQTIQPIKKEGPKREPEAFREIKLSNKQPESSSGPQQSIANSVTKREIAPAPSLAEKQMPTDAGRQIVSVPPATAPKKEPVTPAAVKVTDPPSQKLASGLPSDVGRVNQQVVAVDPKPIDPKSITRDVAELKKLRETGNESAMVPVLERLAEKYSQSRSIEKAYYAYAAALSIREKLALSNDLDLLLFRSAHVKEKYGDLSGAIEDYTRSAAFYQKKSDTGSALKAQSAATTLAAAIGIDGNLMIKSFERLWQARSLEDISLEIEALYVIGRLYEKAGRNSDALKYYERSSASLLVDKAGLYEKMGKSDLAQQNYDQALEAFKKYDYSKYLNLIKKGKGSKKLSLEDMPYIMVSWL